MIFKSDRFPTSICYQPVAPQITVQEQYVDIAQICKDLWL